LKIKKLLKLIFKEKRKLQKKRKCFFLAWTKSMPQGRSTGKKVSFVSFFSLNTRLVLKAMRADIKCKHGNFLFSENFHIPPIFGGKA
jgi:hypothetical protein